VPSAEAIDALTTEAMDALTTDRRPVVRAHVGAFQAAVATSARRTTARITCAPGASVVSNAEPMDAASSRPASHRSNSSCLRRFGGAIVEPIRRSGCSRRTRPRGRPATSEAMDALTTDRCPFARAHVGASDEAMDALTTDRRPVARAHEGAFDAAVATSASLGERLHESRVLQAPRRCRTPSCWTPHRRALRATARTARVSGFGGAAPSR
jgi:hypothetical protein